MLNWRNTVLGILGSLLLVGAVNAGVTVTGELKKWHKVTLTIDGPQASETMNPNPFTSNRLNVTFTNGDKSYVVPGYFAADGNAANTGAEKGNKWRCHLSPDRTGAWTYSVSFRKGKDVAMSDDPNAGTAVAGVDGLKGTFEIGPTDKTGRDHRAKGRLCYVGKHYLRFAETGEYFLKQGSDAPENLLAYADFDGSFKTDKQKDQLIKKWSAHIKDWKPGDPTWKNGKGKGLIGAINYLASKGMNAFSFLTMNIKGDDRNVFPYINYNERNRMDCSRLEQWEIIFEHADKLGMYLHFKTQETENDQLLDKGDLGRDRKIYYRMLIARFGHHLALNWNLGEENTNTDAQRKAFAQYFWDHDPYHHNIVVHTFPNKKDKVYTPMLGDKSKLTGLSLQTSKRDFSQVYKDTRTWVERSTKVGKPWVVACDEPGDASHALVPDKDDPTHDTPRKNALWGTFMAGGAGNEWYFGYRHAHSDLTCQDFRSRDKWWDQCRIAMEFFTKNKIPFWEMKPVNLTSNKKTSYSFAKPGEVYVIFLKNGGDIKLKLAKGSYQVKWYDPRKGGDLVDGSVKTLKGGASVSLGKPPREANKDWAVLVTAVGAFPAQITKKPIPVK